jgi:hypothetical protein
MRRTPFVLTSAGLMLGVAVGVSAGPVAGKGAADVGPREAFIALLNEGQPAAVGEPDLHNALEMIEPLAARIRAVRERVLAERFAGRDGRGMALNAVMDSDSPEEERAMARAVLEELAKSDVPGLAAAMASAPRAAMRVRAVVLRGGPSPMMQPARAIARYQAGRMVLAAEAKDWGMLRTALREMLTLGDQVGRQPEIIHPLVGVAIEGVGIGTVEWLLAGRMLEAEGLKVVAEELAGAKSVTFDRAVQGERLRLLEAVEWLYADAVAQPNGAAERLVGGQLNFDPRFRGVRVRPEDERKAFGPSLPGFAVDRAAVDEHYQLAGMLVSERSVHRRRVKDPVADLQESAKRTPLLQSLASPWGHVLRSAELAETQRAAIAVMVALERYRLAHGAYPDGLGRLVPEFLASVPVDAYSGGPLGYRLARGAPAGGANAAEGAVEGQAAPDLGGRGYLLYSVGPDLVDDGGRVDLTDPMPKRSAGGEAEAGWDWVLNKVPPRGR